MTGTMQDLQHDAYRTQICRDADGRVEVVVRGAVDAVTRDDFATAVADAERAAPELLRIDLRRATFVSLSSLSVLVAARRRAEARGTSVELLLRHDLTRRLLEYAATLA